MENLFSLNEVLLQASVHTLYPIISSNSSACSRAFFLIIGSKINALDLMQLKQSHTKKPENNYIGSNKPFIKQPDIVTLEAKINPNIYCPLHFGV